jgi:hypothetical protein
MRVSRYTRGSSGGRDRPRAPDSETAVVSVARVVREGRVIEDIGGRRGMNTYVVARWQHIARRAHGSDVSTVGKPLSTKDFDTGRNFTKQS